MAQHARCPGTAEQRAPSLPACLLPQVGGTLEQAVNAQELKWSNKDLDADDAHVVRSEHEMDLGLGLGLGLGVGVGVGSGSGEWGWGWGWG